MDNISFAVRRVELFFFLIMQSALQVTVYTAESNLTLEIFREAKKEQGDSGCSYPAEGSREQYKNCGHFRIKASLWRNPLHVNYTTH